MIRKKDQNHISYEGDDHDAWVCVCGNKPIYDGFYACDSEGNEMSPDIGSDWQNLYVCLHCGRIIKGDTLEVVGQNPNLNILA
jgi:hypothetical protein